MPKSQVGSVLSTPTLPNHRSSPILPLQIKKYAAYILYVFASFCILAGCIVMMLTKEILFCLACILGGILFAVGLILKLRNASSL
ncbi:hypothetical protein [Candidatus Chlamydia sanziniae]|nr:hypothetical protein [Candidatus Chlamydia sanziniae]